MDAIPIEWCMYEIYFDTLNVKRERLLDEREREAPPRSIQNEIYVGISILQQESAAHIHEKVSILLSWLGFSCCYFYANAFENPARPRPLNLFLHLCIVLPMVCDIPSGRVQIRVELSNCASKKMKPSISYSCLLGEMLNYFMKTKA